MKVKACADRSILDPCSLEGRNYQVEAAVFSKEHLYWLALRSDLEQIAKERNLDLSIHV